MSRSRVLFLKELVSLPFVAVVLVVVVVECLTFFCPCAGGLVPQYGSTIWFHNISASKL